MDHPKPRPSVLVVDDEPAVRKALVALLEKYDPLEADDGTTARDILKAIDIDVVVCDLSMPRLDGLSLMRWARDNCPRPTWIVLSALDTFDAAVQALQLGAFDFLAKPLASSALLETVVANAIRQRELIAERESLVRDLAETNLRVTEALSRVEAANLALSEQRAMLEQDFRRAERIQRALLPRVLPAIDRMQVNVAFEPSMVIGGDLYGVQMIDERNLVVYVADAAGHGVSAALLVVLFDQRLRTRDAAGPRSPASVLAELNRALQEECSASGLFLTATYALIDTVTREVTVASAGHPAAMVLRQDGSMSFVQTTGPALGLTRDATFAEQRVTLAEGERLLFHTDGLTQALPPAGPSLAALFRAASDETDDGAAIVTRLLERTGANTPHRDDDVTIVLVTAHGGASTTSASTSAAPSALQVADSPLFAATKDGTTWVSIRGRATWTHAPSLQETCVAAFDAGQTVVIDLGACEALDSTLLGTLHGLATQAEARHALQIQNVPDEIRRLFHELALAPVLAVIAQEPSALTQSMAPLRAKGGRAAQELLLHAHEILAAINAQNAAQFVGVVEALRQEVDPPAPR